MKDVNIPNSGANMANVLDFIVLLPSFSWRRTY